MFINTLQILLVYLGKDAKAHTFKPLYGGVTGTEDEKRYYTKFLEKYKDIKTWHEKLQSEAIRFKKS